MKKGKNNNRGISLIEVIVAVTMFITVAAPLVGMFSYSLRLEKRSLLHTLATYTAQMKMEVVQGMNSDELNELNTSPLIVEGVPELTYMYLVEPLSSDSLDVSISGLNLYRVIVTVRNDNYKVEVTLEDVIHALTVDTEGA